MGVVDGMTVVDAPQAERYEARGAGGELFGFAAYQRIGTRIAFTHTEVDEAYEGQGVAARLVQGALDDVRARRPDGPSVVPLCPYVRAWLRRHPEYADLVVPAPDPG